jgi:hypothetical protein
MGGVRVRRSRRRRTCAGMLSPSRLLAALVREGGSSTGTLAELLIATVHRIGAHAMHPHIGMSAFRACPSAAIIF